MESTVGRSRYTKISSHLLVSCCDGVFGVFMSTGFMATDTCAVLFYLFGFFYTLIKSSCRRQTCNLGSLLKLYWLFPAFVQLHVLVSGSSSRWRKLSSTLRLVVESKCWLKKLCSFCGIQIGFYCNISLPASLNMLFFYSSAYPSVLLSSDCQTFWQACGWIRWPGSHLCSFFKPSSTVIYCGSH